MKCSLGISNFLEEIANLHPFCCFPVFLCIAPLTAFLFLLAILGNSAFIWLCLSPFPLPFTSLLFPAICKASSDRHFAFLHFFSWEWFWSLPPVQDYKPPSTVFRHSVNQIRPLEYICHLKCITIRDLI